METLGHREKHSTGNHKDFFYLKLNSAIDMNIKHKT
jgi:hypothetical protein